MPIMVTAEERMECLLLFLPKFFSPEKPRSPKRNRKGTHHDPIHLLHKRLTMKAIVHTRDETPHDQCNNPHVIHLSAPPTHLGRMIAHAVIPRAHAQAKHGRGEKRRERQHVPAVHGYSFGQDDANAHAEEEEAAQQVRVDIDPFVVQVEQALETSRVGLAFGPVGCPDEVIVLLPGR